MKSTAAAVVAALAVTIPATSAGKHKMKLHKMPASSSFNSQTALNNLQSQAAWLNQKYFGDLDGNGFAQKKFRYGRPAQGKGQKGEMNIQMIEEEEFEAVNHDVPLSSESLISCRLINPLN